MALIADRVGKLAKHLATLRAALSPVGKGERRHTLCSARAAVRRWERQPCEGPPSPRPRLTRPPTWMSARSSCFLRRMFSSSCRSSAVRSLGTVETEDT